MAVCCGLFGFSSITDAQQVTLPRRIGVLLSGLSPNSEEAKAFRRGITDAGYSEGHDVVIEWRSASGDYARLPQLAADLHANASTHPRQEPLHGRGS